MCSLWSELSSSVVINSKLLWFTEEYSLRPLKRSKMWIPSRRAIERIDRCYSYKFEVNWEKTKWIMSNNSLIMRSLRLPTYGSQFWQFSLINHYVNWIGKFRFKRQTSYGLVRLILISSWQFEQVNRFNRFNRRRAFYKIMRKVFVFPSLRNSWTKYFCMK